MKKIDKLIIGSFLGPFFLTFFVVIFILLSQFMLKYLDEIVGKDLDTTVIMQLIFYFSIFMTPNAFPLAVLLSSLMTFGNLGEHFELTALKSSGISLIRVMVPIFVFSIALTGAAYYSNNFIVPKANLKAFSLLYDVKQMKPSMELKEGTFYNGIENYSIKVGEKYPDGKSLKDLVIYDHTSGQGNKHITLADSGRMYNILNDRYLVLELFNGYTYREQTNTRRKQISQPMPDPLVRNKFESQKVVFSLASFDMKRTKEELFSSNRLMKNSTQLKADVDSMKTEFVDKTEEVKEHSFQFFDFHLQDIVKVYKEQARKREELARRRDEEKMRGIYAGDSSYQQYDDEAEEYMEQYAQDSSATLKDTAAAIKDFIPLDTAGVIVSKDEQMENTISRFQTKARAGLPGHLKLENTRKKDRLNTKDGPPADTSNVSQSDSVQAMATFAEHIRVADSVMSSPDVVKTAYNRALPTCVT
ncbi:MAG: YjgP/YjgQ family permease [Cyclobacteriaceae bacterium]|nr:YjgP/YjgQ family permease [Cyclobacteriaceae bacterium]